jgi:hypothetical protein
MYILKKIFIKYPLFIRLISYWLIWISYLYFMQDFSPLGVTWLNWHEERIFNFVEFLKLNGYFSFYGYSIWNECINCNLASSQWLDQIYVSQHFISFAPHILLNHLFGKEAFLYFGPIIDKTAIFIAAAALSELSREMLKKNSKLPLYIVSILCFSLFSLNPWTYKMLVGPWIEIYFLMFFLLGLLAFNNSFSRFGLIFFFFAALAQYQWAFLISAFYLFIIIWSVSLKNHQLIKDYFPGPANNLQMSSKIVLSLLVPTLGIILLRIIAQSYLGDVSGSSLLYRIGITGVDIHNGGLLGALQFLGGNRITNCLNGIEFSILSSDLNMKISLFNCILSIGSMLIISIISVTGIAMLLRTILSSRTVILPLLFSFLTMLCILQQSFSVHLMGYSYIFGALFAMGLTAICALSFNSVQSSIIRLIFVGPIAFGIIIASIRVSMLTGING